MPHYDLEYPKKPFSTVKRLNSRANYALETIHTIINAAPILHVSFSAPNSPFPAILPMLGAMGSFSRPSADLGDVLDLYLHGYVSSRLMNLSRQAKGPTAAGTSGAGSELAENGDSDAEEGLPVCVAASHLDGLVLALTPMHHSFNYRSAVLFGRASVVASTEEKLYAMELITNNVIPGRWAGSRVPPNAAEMASTSVLRVRIATGSAKIRTGTPGDDREDLESEEVMSRVWTGVVPVYQTIGEPVAASYNRVSLPAYIEEYRRDSNEEAKRAAEEAISTPITKKDIDDE